MSVEFNEENSFDQMIANRLDRAPSGLTAWIIKQGLAKNESGANSLMVIITIVCFTLAIFFAVK